MVSEEYIQHISTLIDHSDLNYDQFKNKIQKLQKEETIVIYGGGGGGKWLLELLSKYSVKVTAFLDSDSGKLNTSIEGLPIYNPANSPVKDSNALIIIALRSNKAQQEVIKSLEDIGFHNIILYSKIWNNFFNNPDTDIKKVFDPDKLVQAAKLWKDQKSTDLFLDAIKFHTVFDYELNGNSGSGIQYLPDDIPLKEDFDCFIDCGAYTGDTIMQLHNKCGRVREIIAFEPDTENFLKLSQYLKENSKNVCDQLFLYPCGVWSETTQMRFSDGHDDGSAVTQDGKSIKQFVALDEVIFNINHTFLKKDVEGAEVEALHGAKGLISINKPDLAICLYHKISHLWEIVLLIHSWQLGYDFYIRQHDYTMEIVMYATVMEE